MNENNKIVNELKFTNVTKSELAQFYLDHYCFIMDNIKFEDVFKFETGLCMHWIAMNKLYIPLPSSLSKIIIEYTNSEVKLTANEMKNFDRYENEIITKYVNRGYELRRNFYSNNIIVHDTMESHGKECKHFFRHCEHLFKEMSKETIEVKRKEIHRNYIHSFLSYILCTETLKLCVKNRLLRDIKWYECIMHSKDKQLTEMKLKVKQLEEERKVYTMRNTELEGVVKVLKSKVKMMERRMEEEEELEIVEEEEELEIVEEDETNVDEDGRPLKKRKV